MTFRCFGICKSYETIKIQITLLYPLGFKRCIVCDKTFKIDQIRCPCCNVKLRTRPKRSENSKRKQKTQLIKTF